MQTKVIHVDPKTLKLLEMNARFMRHEEFQRLVANVKKDGQLTSAPFAARNADGTYEVLSGNHRVQAAIAAGVESIPASLQMTSCLKSSGLRFSFPITRLWVRMTPIR